MAVRPAKILVVDLGFLGDTIHLLPALWELRRHHPEARLDFVTTPAGAGVIGLVRCVDRVWSYPLTDPRPPWWKTLGLQRRLFRERYDLAFNFRGTDRTLFVTLLTGARRRLTWRAKPYRFWQRWLAGEARPMGERSRPVYVQRRDALAAVGYELGPVRFGLEIPPDAAAWAVERVPDGAVHFSISASTPFKEWPLERWAELARRLWARGAGTLVATGSGKLREQERLHALAQAVDDPRLRTLSDDLTTARLAAVVARCAVHVGTDSGVTHLAVALGRPTVSVYRDYPGLEEWRPRGPEHAVVTAVCRCVDRPRMQPECVTAGKALCLEGISAEAVASLVPLHR